MKFKFMGDVAGLKTYGCKQGDHGWVITVTQSGRCQASHKKWPGETDWLGLDFPNMEAAQAACEEDRKKRLQ